ncbi:MAG: hypothetical protein PVJ43_15700, partial [Gemmatimonadales bacterium]
MNGDLASKRSSGAPFWTIGGVIVLGWILFTQGHYLGMPLESTADSAIAYSPVALLVLIGLLWFTRDRWYPAVVRLLER